MVGVPPQAPYRFILYPVDCNVQLRVNNDPEQPEVPKRTIQIVSRTVLLGFDDEQYRQLLYVFGAKVGRYCCRSKQRNLLLACWIWLCADLDRCLSCLFMPLFVSKTRS